MFRTMMMTAGMMTAGLAILAATAAPNMARADTAAADACAANLPPDGKAVYAAVSAQKPTQATLKETVEKETRSLAMGGKISRGTARENAVAAAHCLEAGL